MISIIQITKKLLHKYRDLILYGIIGSISASLDFGIYVLLQSLGIYYLVANIISVTGGIVVSFTLNRHYNFKIKDQVWKRFVSFVAVGLTGMIASSALLYLFVEIFNINDILSKLMSIFFVVIGQFVVNKYVTFKKTI